MVLPGFGSAVQDRLSQARALVVGAGGLGCPAAGYLAGAGVNLTIVDPDVVELGNLHRQVLYAQSQVGQQKADIAAQFVRRLNRDIAAQPIIARLGDDEFTEALVSGADVVLDCTDNLPTRYLLNRLCFRMRVPYVWAAIGGTAGRCSVSVDGSPCFECVSGPRPADGGSPKPVGTFGPSCGVLGSLAAGQAVLQLGGMGKSLAGRLANVDLATGEMQVIEIAHDPACATCGHPTCNSGAKF